MTSLKKKRKTQRRDKRNLIKKDVFQTADTVCVFIVAVHAGTVGTVEYFSQINLYLYK